MPGLPLLLLGALMLLAGAAITAWGGLTRTWLNAAVEREGMLLAVRVAAPAVGQVEAERVAEGLAAPPDVPLAEPRRVGRGLMYAGYTLAGAVLLAALGGLTLRGLSLLGPAPAAARQAWTLYVHLGLALLGAGAFVAGAIQSMWFAVRATRPTDLVDPAHALRGRAGDPGRGVTLAAFPLLTAALIAGSLWGLLVFAAPVRTLPAEMWLLAAWLLASAYFHLTSGWRPLRSPVWLGPLLMIAALAAAVAACLAAPSLFTL
jgi:ABC-type transport system involved in cytochrome c biogenesis permease subunit